MALIKTESTIQISDETLVNAFDQEVASGEISVEFLHANLSEATVKKLLDLVKISFGVEGMLTEDEIRDIQDERDIDIDEVLNDLDDCTLLDHIESHRSVKTFIIGLVESL